MTGFVNEKNFLEDVCDSANIITFEENVLSGGLGSYVLEILSDNQTGIPVKRCGLSFIDGVPQIFMNRDCMRERYRLDRNGIADAIDFAIRRLLH